MNKFSILNDDIEESSTLLIEETIVKKEDTNITQAKSDKQVIYSLLQKYNISQYLNDNILLIHNLKLVFFEYLDEYKKNNKVVNDFEGNPYSFFKYCFHTFKVLASRKKEFGFIYDDYKHDLDCKDVAGTFIINKSKTHVLMIKNGVGKYDFPKGKIDENESPKEAAIRETMEEVGFDCRHLLNENKNYNISFVVKISHKIVKKESVKNVSMYLITDIDDNRVFKTNVTEYEVQSIEWIPLDKLDEKIPFIFKQMPVHLSKLVTNL